MGLAVTALIAVVLHFTLITCDVNVTGSCKAHAFDFKIESLPPTFDEFSNRMIWIASVFVLMTTCIGAIALIAAMTYDALVRFVQKRTLKRFLLELLGSAVVIAVFLRWGPLVQPFPLDAPLTKPTVDQLLPVDLVEGIIRVLAITVLLGLAFASSLVLTERGVASPSGMPDDEINHRSVDLARGLRNLRALLVTGAVVLVAGVVQVTALYGWSSTLALSDSAVAERQRKDSANKGSQRGGDTTLTSITRVRPLAAPAGDTTRAPVAQHGNMVSSNDTAHRYLADPSKLTGTMGVLAGTFFSMLLAGIFVPAFLLMRAAALRLGQLRFPEGPESEATDWLEKQGLLGSLPSQVGSLLALLGPLIVGGPGTALLKTLTQ